MSLLFCWGTAAAASDLDPMPPGAASAVLRHRDDVLGVRLTAAAADRARAARPEAGAWAAAPRAGHSSGLSALERFAAGLGVARFEREFPLDAGQGRSAAAAAADRRLDAFFLVHLEPGVDVASVRAALAARPEVETVFPIAVVPTLAIPNDSLFAAAYYFDQPSGRHIGAVSAWDVTTGDPSVIIAILDTGVIPYHPDLAEQMWSNPAEVHGRPGVDDDGNGFVDDTWGWDFVDVPAGTVVRDGEDGRDPDNDPNDFAGHGTAVAGVAAARSNNRIGVTGVAWNARLMPVRVAWATPLHPLGEGDVSAMAQAVRYATAAGASVINFSIATDDQPDFVAAVDAAIAAGVTIVTAAGNLGLIHYLAMREDVISVAATDAQDKVPTWSTTRPYVDLAAPGHRLLTTTVDRPGLDSLGLRQCTYADGASGTSFSSPLVAGAVALMQSRQIALGEPLLTPGQALLRLFDTTRDIRDVNPGLTGFGSGRLDLDRVLRSPSRSRRLEARFLAAGPGVVLPARAGPARLAFVTRERRLAILESTGGAVERETMLPAEPEGGLAAADLGGDHGFGMFVATRDGSVHGYGPDLERLPGWPVTATVSLSPFQHEPALGDLDGDGTREVVWPGAGGQIWAWHADGTQVAGFPIAGMHVEVAIALGDLGGAPGLDIAAVSTLGRIMAYDGRAVPLPGRWPQDLARRSLPPVIATLGVPPRPFLMVSTIYDLYAYETTGVLAWASAGQSGLGLGIPALGDFDGDGLEEIAQMRTAVSLVSSTGQAVWPIPAALRGTVADDLVIAPLGADGELAVVSAGAEYGLEAATRDGRLLARFPKPGRARHYPMVGDLEADGRTDVVAGSADGWWFVYDAGPGTWREAPGWPMSRGNAARTASRLAAPPIAPLDFTPPHAVDDLAAEIHDGRVALTWTAPADDDGGPVARYQLVLTTTIEGKAERRDTLGASVLAPGARHHLSIEVEENARVEFRIRVRDASGNWSAASTPVHVLAGGRRPAAVRDLRVLSLIDGRMVVGWTATGDDGGAGRPRRYRLRAAETTLGEDWYERAPLAFEVAASRDAGALETFAITRLRPGVRYRIALEAVDDRGNVSERSNVIAPWIGPLGMRPGAAIAAATHPARWPLVLFWQAPDGVPAVRGEILLHDVAGRLIERRPLPVATEGVVALETRLPEAGVYFASLRLDRALATTKLVVMP